MCFVHVGMSYLCDSLLCEDQMHSAHEHGCIKLDLIKINVTNGLRSGKMYPDTSTSTSIASKQTEETGFEKQHDPLDDHSDICIDIDVDEDELPVLKPVVKQRIHKSTQAAVTTFSVGTQTNHSCVYKVTMFHESHNYCQHHTCATCFSCNAY